MKIEKLTPWVVLITNVGVLLGVFLLLVELSQNTLALRNQTEYANASEWISLFQSTALSPEMADIVLRGNADIEQLSEQERFRYFQHLSAYMIISESSYFSIRNGTYRYDADANERFILLILDTPGGRAYWELSGRSFSSRFADYVDALLAEADAAAE